MVEQEPIVVFDGKVMKESRRKWKKSHPGFTGKIHDLIERSYDAGFQDGMKYGEKKHVCG